MRAGGQAQAPMTKHPARPGDDGVQDERFETIPLGSQAERQLEDEFVRARQAARRAEASALIQTSRRDIVGCHQQPDPAARPHMPQVL